MCDEMQELGLVLPVAKTQMNEMHNEQMLGERCSLCVLLILVSATCSVLGELLPVARILLCYFRGEL